jgi:hypothetical protein
MDFAHFLWLLLWSFVFISYLFIFFYILGDLFRDAALSGWWKAIWIVLLVVFPFGTALVYLIARGKGMTERPAGRGRGLHPVRRRCWPEPRRPDRLR